MIVEHFWPSGHIQERKYYPGSESCKPHDLLDEQTWYSNGQKRTEIYRFNNKLSRIHGPAVKWYDTNGNLVSQEYWRDGSRHNPLGPAVVVYGFNEKGEFGAVIEQYWEFGEQSTASQIHYRKYRKKTSTQKINKHINQRKLALKNTFDRPVYAQA